MTKQGFLVVMEKKADGGPGSMHSILPEKFEKAWYYGMHVSDVAAVIVNCPVIPNAPEQFEIERYGKYPLQS